MGLSTFTSNGAAPFVFDDNWDNFGNLRPESRRLSDTNSDGLPVVPLTEEQKFVFDTQGWLCIPGVLDAAELDEMREFCYRLKDDAESLPPHQRTPIAGPLEKLLDHPVVVGFCNEFLAYHRLDGADHYGFRFETSFLFYRELGRGKFSPHNGNGVWRLPGSSHEYRVIPGKAYSARPWTNAEVPRLAIFNQYNGIGSRFHWWEPPHELLESMPKKRRSLFRHAYGEAANTGLETRNLFTRALG